MPVVVDYCKEVFPVIYCEASRKLSICLPNHKKKAKNIPSLECFVNSVISVGFK